MHTLKEEHLKSHELLDQWANKDTQKAKPKKSKKSLEWNAMGSKHQIAGNKSVLETTLRGQLTSAKLNQKNAIRTANNKIDQPSLTRENTIAKKTPPLAVEPQQQPPNNNKSKQQQDVFQKDTTKQTAQQKDSINSISSSVTSGSVNNTMTTTSSEASSSRSNSAKDNPRMAQTTVVLETTKKNSVRPLDKTTPSAPPPPPATTINPPAKTDFNLVVKKNSVIKIFFCHPLEFDLRLYL